MSAVDMTPDLALDVLRREVVRLRTGAGGYGGRSREALTLAHAIETLFEAELTSFPGESVLRGLRIMGDAVHIDDNPRHPERNGMASIDGCYIGPPDDPAHADVRSAKEWLEAGFRWQSGNPVCQCGHLAGTHQSERARAANGEAPCGADGCGCTLSMEDVLRECGRRGNVTYLPDIIDR